MTRYLKIVAENFGAPDVLQLREVDEPLDPDKGEALVRIEAAGVGYTDTIVRRGRYVAYTGGLPVTPGYDLVGIVERLGSDVAGLAVGDRVLDMPVTGSYSQYIVRPAADLIPVPGSVDPAAAIDVPLMWMTAWQMLTRSVSLSAGERILVVGGGGAVGRALVLLGRHLGLDVIATTSTAKMAFVGEMGAFAIDYGRTDLENAIREATDGNGVSVAFDAMGGESWDVSWSSLAQGGVLVGYGLQGFLESGAPSTEAIAMMKRFHRDWPEAGMTDRTGRRTVHYDIQVRRKSQPDEYRADAIHLLDLISKKSPAPPPAHCMPLANAAEAHRLVAEGRLHSRIVLRPWS